MFQSFDAWNINKHIQIVDDQSCQSLEASSVFCASLPESDLVVELAVCERIWKNSYLLWDNTQLIMSLSYELNQVFLLDIEITVKVMIALEN